MKNLILIKTESKLGYYLNTCPVFDESRDKALRDFKDDIKNAYEGLTGLNCKAWFVDEIKPKNFLAAKDAFFETCRDFYGLNLTAENWITDNNIYLTTEMDSFGMSFRLSSWSKSFSNFHIVIELNKNYSFKGLSYRGVSHAEAAQFLGLWIESCINTNN